VPAIVDGNTLQWALQMKLGDTLDYQDERGEPFKVRLVAALAGSMLQGSVLISEKHLSRGFRAERLSVFPHRRSGDDRRRRAGATLACLAGSRAGAHSGSAPARGIPAVENTYLSIFQVLGGLGLLLGSAGLGIVVARNVLERRRELGCGGGPATQRGQMRQLVFAEHGGLLFRVVIGVGECGSLQCGQGCRERAGGFP
jgi:hypothetical protein